jgi:hypothetical protein
VHGQRQTLCEEDDEKRLILAKMAELPKDNPLVVQDLSSLSKSPSLILPHKT